MEKFLLRHISRVKVVCGIIIVLATIHNLMVFYPIFRDILTNKATTLGWSAQNQDGKVIINRVGDPLKNRLITGDQLLEINQQTIKYAEQRALLLGKLAPQTPYSITINRNNRTYRIILTVMPAPTVINLAFYVWLEVSVTFLLTGILFFTLRSQDLKVIILTLFLVLFSVTPPLGLIYKLPLIYITPLVLLYSFSRIYPALLLYFFLIFPQRSLLLQWFPKLEYLVIASGFSLVFAELGNHFSNLYPDTYYQLLSYTPNYLWIIKWIIDNNPENFLAAFYLISALLVLIDNYRQVNLVAKRKLKVILFGTVIGLTPILTFQLVVSFIDPVKYIPLDIFVFFYILAFSMPTITLASFAYAIFRHQVLPISLIIRRSVRYMLVSGGFILLQTIVILAGLYFLLRGNSLNFIRTLDPATVILFTIAGTTFMLYGLRTLNDRVSPFIDRRFFRETYDAQQLLTELGQSVRHMTNIPALVKFAGQKIQDALHTEQVIFLLKNEATGQFYCTFAQDYTSQTDLTIIRPAMEHLELSDSSPIIQKFRDVSAPIEVDLSDPQCWLTKQPGRYKSTFDNPEICLLRELNTALLVPIASKNTLWGIISLGPKMSEISYSQEDKRMLTAVALQIAFAIENSNLIQHAIEEQKLKKDLEMATEVQRRLFPQIPPQIWEAEVAGSCFPARGVAGDYYDFIQLNHDKVGIAIADVAGKGLSAALLMSVVQASLRSQVACVSSLTELVATMNQLLYHSTSSNSYATFFYGEYNWKDQTLTYVNAGHNPPILVRQIRHEVTELVAPASIVNLRRSSTAIATLPEINQITTQAQCLQLQTGGPVIGLLELCTYQQATIQLQSGDVLVAFTDGVTEALNNAGEEFGESRLEELILGNLHLSAEALKSTIISYLEQWCLNTPQHDDITVVVLKIS
jgi:phosphoserine phosphatase RsbU/P